MGAWDTEGAPRPGLIRGKCLMDQDNVIFPQYKAKYDHLLLTTSRQILEGPRHIPKGQSQVLRTNSRVVIQIQRRQKI